MCALKSIHNQKKKIYIYLNVFQIAKALTMICFVDCIQNQKFVRNRIYLKVKTP